MIQAVLFDLDGTLVDTAADFSLAVNDLRMKLGLSKLTDARIAKDVSNGSVALTQLATELQPEQPEFKSQQQQLLQYYNKYLGSAATLYSGINELLQHFKQQKIKWGIVTNKPANFAIPLLEKLNLHQQYNCLICPDHVSKPKPDPEALLLAAKQLSVQHHHCIYVGDHLRDIQAGKAAQMHTIAATYGYIADHDQPDQWQADHNCATPQSLCQLLKSLTNKGQ